MRLTGKGIAGVAVATVACLAAAIPAHANFVATGTDPSGDARDPNPGRDVTALAMAYTRKTGALSGAIRFRGEPEVGSFITLVAGTRTPTGCNGYPAGGFGSYSNEFGGIWLRLDSASGPAGARGDADKRGGGSKVQTFEATDRALAGRRWNCVTATVSQPNNPGNVYDAAGPISLVGKPGLSVRVRGVPKRFKRNRARRLKITVSNTGDGPARRVKLRLGRARGLRTSPRAKSLHTIAAGRRKTVRVRVRLTRRARTVTKLVVKARSGKLAARRSLRLRLRGRSRGGGGGGGSKSCLRYAPDLSGETGGSLILVPC